MPLLCSDPALLILRVHRQTVVWGVRGWLKAASRLLGVDDYLLPRPAGEEAPGNNQQPPAVIPLAFQSQILLPAFTFPYNAVREEIALLCL